MIGGELMSLGLQIFLKILLYSIIIIVVRGVISKIQKPAKEIATTEWGEELIDWKIFSIIYLAVAVIFAIILAFVLSYPSNLEGARNSLSTGIFVLIILFFLLLSILYGQVYVKIGKEKIYWRKMNGKKCEVRYEDITSYTVDGSSNVKLYQGDKCILAFATGEHKVFVTAVLKNHKVSTNTVKDDTTIVMRMGKGYVIFDAVCIGVLAVFFGGCAYYGMLFGAFFFFVCFIGSVFSFFSRKARHIMVENRTIIEKRLMRKPKNIHFSEVEYLTLAEGNNTAIICIHSKTGSVIKIPQYFRNVEMFETIITKQHWRWK